MVTSDFRPEVEIWPFRACAMKNMQYNRYYMEQIGHYGLGYRVDTTFHRTYF